jgi:hypothetical protein
VNGRAVYKNVEQWHNNLGIYSPDLCECENKIGVFTEQPPLITVSKLRK